MARKADIVLEVKNLVKKFDDFVAVDDISFTLGEGQVLGLLGPNGAGKSTTIFCILGLIEKNSGEVKIFGKDFASNRSEILTSVNYASNESQLPWNLTVFENLLVFAHLYTINDVKKRIMELLDVFEISNLRKNMVRDLSSGQRARLSLVKAFLNRPKLLLLDEPMASMDPDVVDKGITLIKNLQKEEKMSILYTSHNMWEIEEIANDIIFINHGKIVAKGSPIDLTKKVLKGGAREPNLREVFIHISRQL
ncbi:hypothetical protein A2696_01390 [Candidatus Curtissbacteria bacterium RIFCSPHIGHO2_01_FULL_41_13]|uniref:ABC transporter domain-containing protein n=1 Tax=Candidatus Curtissbacteria bacterium RIFCSPHIGHO2_01_FULL_41_13 TaxID=1797745 RepID=A0A1F5FY01_9BACT|nr:MAG: hypothetical protein A2696_01390 [Candidatus Curtissbacteria bacterium RIFCSPHIGHO2_01_FULL_41_13]